MDDKESISPKTKTIYNSSYREIFWKNFLAGLGSGLGALCVYIIFYIGVAVIFFYFILPPLMPSINAYNNFFKSVSSLINTKPPSDTSPTNILIQKLLGK